MSKHTDVPSWSGSPALAQLQSRQMYDDRVGDGARSRPMEAHPQILERSVPFCSSQARLMLRLCWEITAACLSIEAVAVRNICG